MRLKFLILLALVLILIFFSQPVLSQAFEKHRLIVLTDIEAEPDDTQSLVRLLLYSSEIDIEGLIATTSCWHKTRVDPDSIRKVIQAYGSVRPNLEKHESGFPTAEDLLRVVTRGLPVYGMQGVGEGKNSEGSDLIIKVLKEEDDRPLWVSVWGGASTLAQALFEIRRTSSVEEAARLISKLRVYTISDQDDTGMWIRNTFPDLSYIVSPGDDYGSATWSAINGFIEGIDNEKISNSWLARNIQQGHGPLGVAYPDVAYGMEGDTPSWLLLIPNGLNVPEHPEWGGWGGRYELKIPDFSKVRKGDSGVPFEPETRKIWTDTSDKYVPFVESEYGRTVVPGTASFEGNKVTFWRWRDDLQNDFAARMDWAVLPYTEANHPPQVILDHSREITAQSGQYISLRARKSTDPDGDHLSFLWFNYPEAGTYGGLIEVSPANLSNAYVRLPEVKREETVHFIVRVTDKGVPQLSRYKRVIVRILPK
jgi:hypothetical protein